MTKHKKNYQFKDYCLPNCSNYKYIVKAYKTIEN